MKKRAKKHDKMTEGIVVPKELFMASLHNLQIYQDSLMKDYKVVQTQFPNDFEGLQHIQEHVEIVTLILQNFEACLPASMMQNGNLH